MAVMLFASSHVAPVLYVCGVDVLVKLTFCASSGSEIKEDAQHIT